MKHVFPSDLIAENETAAALRRMLAYLEEHGWCQGTATNQKGEACLEYALQMVGGGVCSPAQKKLREVIRIGLVDWNDSPLTTFADVRAALLKAIEGAQCRT